MAEVLSAWDRVQIARMAERPTSLDYISTIFDEFMELHGDRAFRDDGAIVGMPYPEGYRKALRLMKQAEKFHRPIICFVDTPGAFCGLEAEERGQGEAIARNLYEMSNLTTPILSIVIGEGGSGGALALAVANKVWMLENATYSILSPEGFASILWKDAKKAEEAAKAMKITASDLKELGVIDKVILEEEPAQIDTIYNISDQMREGIEEFLAEYQDMEKDAIVKERYDKFRAF